MTPRGRRAIISAQPEPTRPLPFGGPLFMVELYEADWQAGADYVLVRYCPHLDTKAALLIAGAWLDGVLA